MNWKDLMPSKYRSSEECYNCLVHNAGAKGADLVEY